MRASSIWKSAGPALVPSNGDAPMTPGDVASPPIYGGPRNRVGSTYPPGSEAFFRRWVACTVAGEAAGFTVAAALAATQDLTHMSALLILLGAGAIEGALLGRGQAMAMNRLQLPAAILRLWPVATSVAAMVAWSIGLIPSSLERISWSSWTAWLVAGVIVVALLASIPTAQFMLLRTALPGAGRWIKFNALAWLLGLSWTFAPPAVVKPDTPVISEIGVYAIAGVLMATTVGIITGLCWLSWLKRGSVRPVIREVPD